VDAVAGGRAEPLLGAPVHHLLPRRAGRNDPPGAGVLLQSVAYSAFLRGDLLRADPVLHAAARGQRLRVSGAPLQPRYAQARGEPVLAVLFRLDGDGGADLLAGPGADDRLAALDHSVV